MVKRVTVYKATNSEGLTGIFGGKRTVWKVGQVRKVRGGGELCSNRWLHAYETIEDAIMFDCVGYLHNGGILWRARALVGRRDLDKIGCYELEILSPVKFKRPSKIALRRCCMRLALAISKDKAFLAFGRKWLKTGRTLGWAKLYLHCTDIVGFRLGLGSLSPTLKYASLCFRLRYVLRQIKGTHEYQGKISKRKLQKIMRLTLKVRK